jgi:hypothetical protein
MMPGSRDAIIIAWQLFRTMRSWYHDVVLVKRTIDLRCWEFGMGREWGGDGKGKVSLRVTWGQSGQDRITPKDSFQVSKREWKGK